MADPIETVQAVQAIIDPVVTRLLLAVILLLIGFVLGRVVGKVLHKVLKEIEFDKILKKATTVDYGYGELISRIVTYLIYFIFIITALDRLGIQTVAFNILLGGFIILIFLMVILGVKDFVPNFIAGIVVHKKGFIAVGDKIKVGDIEGKIVEINTIETTITTKKGDTLFIPNSFLTKNTVLKLK
jgi:small-conductance mechanosensitive channel